MKELKDPIVEEVRKVRQNHAKKFGFDLDKNFKDLKKREIRSGIKVVSRQPKLHLKKTA